MIPFRAQVPSGEQGVGRGYGVRVKGGELRRQMRIRGLTGAELAGRAGVSAATVSQAVNDRRIHPHKLRAIVNALVATEPVPGMAEFAADEPLAATAAEQAPQAPASEGGTP